MRLAVDARSLSGERTGVGRTIEGLYDALLRLFPGDSAVFLSPRPIVLPEVLAGRVEVVPPARPRLPGTLWLQTVAPVEALRAGADLFHGPLGGRLRRALGRRLGGGRRAGLQSDIAGGRALSEGH